MGPPQKRKTSWIVSSRYKTFWQTLTCRGITYSQPLQYRKPRLAKTEGKNMVVDCVVHATGGRSCRMLQDMEDNDMCIIAGQKAYDLCKSRPSGILLRSAST